MIEPMCIVRRGKEEFARTLGGASRNSGGSLLDCQRAARTRCRPATGDKAWRSQWGKPISMTMSDTTVDALGALELPSCKFGNKLLDKDRFWIAVGSSRVAKK